MIALILSVLLFQVIPVQQPGRVTGMLRLSDGKPAAGVRISAVPQTNALEEATGGPTLSSITETDAQGRFQLDTVPPGRYFIAAGRLDLLTYYPGTPNMAAGQTILVTAGATVSSIDFVLNANSVGRSNPGEGTSLTLLNLPFEVRSQGSRLPLLAAGKPVTIQLTPVTSATAPISAPINASIVSITPPISDYRVSVENLPAGFTVTSVKANSTELPDRILTLTQMGVSTGAGAFWPNAAAYTAMTAARNSGNPSAQPLQLLSVTIQYTAPAGGAGVRVSGSLPPNTVRSLYLAGVGSTVFPDGTFEFRNVLPGKYVIATRDAISTGGLAAVIVVGTRDLPNVSVSRTAVLPLNVGALLSSATDADSRTPGVVPLASMRGRVVDSETGQPLTAGNVFLVGDTWTKFELGVEGRFEFPMLMPGRYEIEVQGFGYPTFRRPVVIEEKDLDLELKAS